MDKGDLRKYGNGYSWEGVARLRRLGELMRDAATDPERLRRYLAAGDPDWFD